MAATNVAHRAPWYARTATTAGRPAVLAIALAMCAPGEYHLARLAGWSDPWAYGMPAALSAYAGIAAVVAASRPKGAPGRASAIFGAGIAIALALAAQVVAHLIDRGHMVGNQAWLVGLISAVPPAVVGHLLHLASTPVARVVEPEPTPRHRAGAPVQAPVAVPVLTQVNAPAAIPPMPAAPPALPPIQYTDPRAAAIRPLYNSGFRPTTGEMSAALQRAGHGKLTGGTIRGRIRAEVEAHEPHLAAYPERQFAMAG